MKTVKSIDLGLYILIQHVLIVRIRVSELSLN